MASMSKRLRTELIGLQAEISRLQKQAEGLRLTIDYLEAKDNVTSVTSPAANPGPGRPKRQPSAGPSAFVQDMIEVLRANNATMHYKDIYDALVQKGVHVGGQDPIRNVSAHISLNKEFFQPYGSGMWGLSERGSSVELTITKPRLMQSDLDEAEREILKNE
jgi:hypothetical protein